MPFPFQPNYDPRRFAPAFPQQPVGWGLRPAVPMQSVVPIPVPVPAPAPTMRQSMGRPQQRVDKARQTIADWTAPDPNRSGLGQAVRSLGALPLRAIVGASDAANAFGSAVEGLVTSPNQRADRIFASMLQQESGGKQLDKNGRPLTSSAGAIGIAQVMPGTAPEAAKLAGLAWDPQRYRTDANYNKALGNAYFRMLYNRFGGDEAKAVAAYNAGPGGVDKAVRKGGENWTAFLPKETQNYLPSVFGRIGELAGQWGAAPPAFNAAPYQQALEANDQIAALAKQPFQSPWAAETPRPEMPKPLELKAPDFSAGNAAFEAARPKNPFDDPQERHKTLKQGWLRGMAEAAMSSNPNSHIGQLLFRMGAGALAGRQEAEEQIDRREAQFEAAMQQYNMALASRNDQQVAAATNVMNQNLQERNQYNNRVWAENIRQIEKNDPQVVQTEQGPMLVTREKNDKGEVRQSFVPFGPSLEIARLRQRSAIGLTMGAASADHSMRVFQHVQSTAQTALGLAIQQSNTPPEERGAGYLTELLTRTRGVAEAGSWKGMFDRPDIPAQLERDIYGQLGIQVKDDGTPLTPLSKEQKELYVDMVATELAEWAVVNKKVHKFILHPNDGGVGPLPQAQIAGANSAAKNRTVTTRTNARGQTSTSESVRY